MNRKHRVLRPFLFAAGLACSAVLLAHSALTETFPADGATVNAAPEKLGLAFNEDVRLLRVSLSGEDSGAVETGFRPQASAAKQFSLALPALAEDSYTVEWTIMGSDSHRVEGNFSFTVDAAAAPVSGHAEGHAGHQGH